jgi:hypothetical protein
VSDAARPDGKRRTFPVRMLVVAAVAAAVTMGHVVRGDRRQR